MTDDEKAEPGTFTLRIKLSDTLKTPDAVGYALISVARDLQSGKIKGEIIDMNNQKIGEYNFNQK